MPATHPLLQMRGITKTFPGVRALHKVDFTLLHGEIHALLGENGAGKSTLIKVLTGVERCDAGTIELDGKLIQPHSPHHAQMQGISTVYQEVNLCPNLSVAENIYIGREPRRMGRIDWRRMNRDAADLLHRLDLAIDVQQTLDNYSVAIQQMVAIARALDISAQVLILDEPTSSLDANEVAKLFAVMRRLRDEGLGIIFITHFLDQVYAVSDRITVLRNGEWVGTYATAGLPRLELVSKMIGKDLQDLFSLMETKRERPKGLGVQPALQARQLARAGAIEPFDLDLTPGEVVGLAGLLGSGRSEIAHLLFGLDAPTGGELRLDGAPVKQHSPHYSISRGVGLCPEDRKADGIVADLTVRENIILALQANRGWFRALSRREQDAIATRYIDLLDISTPDAGQLVKNLSGGNQQKVILARWLATDPRVLLLDEPTRGIDIGAKTEIQKLVLELADEGKAILFISSELDEVIRCSHSVAVLRDQQVVAQLEGDAIDEEQIMRLMAEHSAPRQSQGEKIDHE